VSRLREYASRTGALLKARPRGWKSLRRIVTDQGNVDICRLCSGYGVPALNRSRPMAFEVQRMSIDDPRLTRLSFRFSSERSAEH